MHRVFASTLLAILLLLGLATAYADDVQPAAEVDAVLNQQHQRWIEQLGDADFDKREKAARALLADGDHVRAALTQGLRDPDLEIRLRCRELLSVIAARDLDRRLTAFIEDVDGKLEHDLPGWKEYRESAGNDPESRRLFADIFRSERELLQAINAPKQECETLFITRANRMQQEIYGQFGASRYRNRYKPSVPALAGILLIATQKDKLSSHANSQLYQILAQSTVKDAITNGSRKQQLTKLMTRWITNSSSNSSVARYCMMLSMQYSFKDATLELGRKRVAASGISIYELQYAVLGVGKYGNQEDIPLLERHLDNKTVCHTWRNGINAEPIQIQVRDVVLATLIHIAGENHKDYGFDSLQKNEQMLFHIYTCGFADPNQREKAMAKWRSRKGA